MHITTPIVALFALAAGVVAEEQGKPGVYAMPTPPHQSTYSKPSSTPSIRSSSTPVKSSTPPVYTTPTPRSSSIVPPVRNITTSPGPRGSSTPVVVPTKSSTGGTGGGNGGSGGSGSGTGSGNGGSTSVPPSNPGSKFEAPELTYFGAALGALGAFMVFA